MKNPLHVAFLWHMHQPYYKDPLTGEVSMPWVRLHAIKDYLDMVQILDDFPKIHMIFNLVPSLMEQLNDYAGDPAKIKDKFIELSIKPADTLSKEERIFLLLNFFMANWENMIKPLHRYYDLLAKRGKYISPIAAEQIAARFSDDDFRDLQVLFNLSWFDPYFREHIPQIRELVKKGAYYSEEDKKAVFETQSEIIRTILPKYKSMQESGQIEVSTSAYYHPILPLLCDTEIARTSAPNAKLPRRFSYPQDALFQIKMAIERYRDFFGISPRGFWPSEGSVSEEVAEIFMRLGVKWIATDEEILYRSTKKQRSAEALYRPYLLRRAGKNLSIVFRDRGLSDAIGFVYGSMRHKDAVMDFMNHLRRIRDVLKDKDRPGLVSVILDGENAWEYYANDGRDFLNLLYERLSDEPDIRMVTLSEHLDAYPPEDEISELYPGSWINANFAVWIGHEEKNLAWNYLNNARDELVSYEKSNQGEQGSAKSTDAWREIYVAEGSDWNWWYGDDHYSSNQDDFDRIYRNHLANVYRLIGKDVPDYLKRPIRIHKVVPMYEPTGYLSPVIDGRLSDYYEWLAAGYLDVSKSGGTMHQSQGIIRHLYYGFDKENLYIRVDLELPEEKEEEVILALIFSDKFKLELRNVDKKDMSQCVFYKKDEKSGWMRIESAIDSAFDKVLEIKLPLNDLDLSAGQELGVLLNVERKGFLLEAAPARGPLVINAPTKDFETFIWSA